MLTSEVRPAEARFELTLAFHCAPALAGIKPANLALWASRPLDKEEADCVRAAYIRERLPRMIESA